MKKTSQTNWTKLYFIRILALGWACGFHALAGGTGSAAAFAAAIQMVPGTRVDVADVRGTWTENEGRVTWTLESTWGTAGFYVYRVDPMTGTETRLNENLLPVKFYASSAAYELADPQAVAGGAGSYRLEAIELSGAVLDLGVHAVAFEPPLPAAKIARAPRSVAPARREAPAGTSSVLKVLLRKEGIYGVSLDAIANGLGIALEEVQALAEEGTLSFRSQGRPVPVLYDGVRGRVLFHGQPTANWYTRDASYLISAGEGCALPRREPGATEGESVFPVQMRFEEDRLPLDSVERMPEDLYYWNFIVGSTDPDANRVDFDVDLDGYEGGALTLTVDLQGWSKSTWQNPDHHAEFSLNGTPVGEIEFDDQETATAVLEIPAGIAVNGTNALTVRGALDAAFNYSCFVLDGITAEYDRTLAPLEETAYLRAGSATTVSAGAFEEPLAMALDDEGWYPTWIADANGEIPAKAWAVAAENERFAVIEADAVPMLVPEPAAEDAWFMSETNQIDYLVVASRALAPAAQELADYRAAQGWRVGVAAFEDICDLLYDGLLTPEAIPEFLSYAAGTWAEFPQMMVLAGNGHNDYLEALGNEANHVPPLLLQTAEGFFAADGLLAEAGGEEGPDLAIGRLPARSAEELAAMIAKIKAYEADSGSAWQSELVFAADQADAAGDYPASNTRLTDLVASPYSVAARIDLDAMAIAPARAALAEAFNAGAGFIHYTGYGLAAKWSRQGLLTSADVGALTNARLPVVVSLSSLVGHYEAPAANSLAELLVQRAEGGAVAVWASSAFSLNAPATDLGEAFYRAVLQEGSGLLGPAILGARQSLTVDPSNRDTLATYNLLGDPALLLGGDGTDTYQEPQSSAQVILQDLEQTYDGTPKSATATTDPEGLAVAITYDGSPDAPTEAGTYEVVATICDAECEGGGSGTLTVSKAAGMVTLGGLEQTYDGIPKVATATTEPEGLAVEITYDGSAEAPAAAGSYAVVATVVDPNYEGSATGTLTIAAAPSAFENWLQDEQGQDREDPDFAADEDVDGDGATTWEEFLADTDPADPDSCLVIAGSYVAAETSDGTGEIRMQFTASPDRYYQLEFCTDLAQATPEVINLGWGVPGMTVTNNSTGAWFGVIRVLMQEPAEAAPPTIE